MKCVILGFMCLALANAGLIPATTFVRSPAHDSAIIKSDRFGGNFAYSTVEGHAYSAISPVVQRIAEPVAVSYTAHPVHLGYAAVPTVHAAPVFHASYYNPIVAAPAFIGAQPIIAAQADNAPVAPAKETAEEAPSKPIEETPASDDADSVSVESA